MAVYVVTGKLGGGKTLACVDRIRDALVHKRKVATNLDLQVHHLPGVGRFAKHTRVLRVPDRPRVHDIEAIGYGVEGISNDAKARAQYDESRFGVLVLDECGTWFNARNWNEEGRKELIDLLLHIRKKLWDVYLIVQDISMLDKQARKALAEHVVYCRRTDRLQIPLFGGLLKLLSGGDRIALPRVHFAIVKYGDQQHSPNADRWTYRGGALYLAYDTVQVFSADYEHGTFSVLPPWYQFARSRARRNWRFYMRLTAIHLRKWSQVQLLAAGVALGAVSAYIVGPNDAITQSGPLELADMPSTDAFYAGVNSDELLNASNFTVSPSPAVVDAKLFDELARSEITGYSSFEAPDGQVFTRQTFERPTQWGAGGSSGSYARLPLPAS